MKTLNVSQGSPEWLAARSQHFCASDAPAMMGASKYMTRDELVRRKATGDVPEVDAATQALFDKGHAAEAAARAIVEEAIGDDLYPVTATDDDGYLLASYDGITIDGKTGFEHKLWNEELAAQVRAGELSPHYYWQLEQQILIAGLERIIFACSDGTAEKMERMEYRAVPGRAQQLLAGWRQFDEDVKNYRHVEVLPPPTATPKMGLPAVSIQVQGSITLTDNLKVFGERLEQFIEAIDKNPSDDQAFADAEAAIKTLGAAEEALDAAKSNALAQTASIDDMVRTVAMYANQARSTRLMLEKLVKARKETIRDEIRREGIDALAAHVAMLNKRLGKPYMPMVPADFAGVMKGKKTIASLRDAVNTELARTKIAANEIADKIEINLNTLRELAADHAFLFADTAQLVLKANDDLTALIKTRIADHKAAEQKRLDAERERIRAEEAARLDREHKAKEPAATQPSTATTTPAPSQEGVGQGAAAPAAAKPSVKLAARGGRPSDDDIIAALALHYRVHESKVIEWLLDMNLDAAAKRMAREFA